jgi:hypothetical protein
MMFLWAIKCGYRRLSQLFGVDDDVADNIEPLYTIMDFDDVLMRVWLKTPYTHTSFSIAIHEVHNKGFVDGMSSLHAFFWAKN